MTTRVPHVLLAVLLCSACADDGMFAEVSVDASKQVMHHGSAQIERIGVTDWLVIRMQSRSDFPVSGESIRVMMPPRIGTYSCATQPTSGPLTLGVTYGRAVENAGKVELFNAVGGDAACSLTLATAATEPGEFWTGTFSATATGDGLNVDIADGSFSIPFGD